MLNPAHILVVDDNPVTRYSTSRILRSAGWKVTEAETGLGRVVLWWDTGTPLSILTTRFARQARPKLTEGPMLSDRLGLAGTEFGPWPFEVVNLSLPPGFDGFIGYDFFAQHVVCMDFPGRKVLVRRN